MTVDGDDKPDEDDFLASLARLRTCDVSQRRSRQLRGRCHAMLQAEPSAERLSRMVDGAFRREIVPALGGVWCLAYLVEIVRCTAAIYGYFGSR
jgi:hypothetical protein